MTHRSYSRVLLSVVAVVAGAFALAAEKAPRPEKWAKPIEAPGVPNLHKVSDDLYRSAQPTSKGMQEVKKLGIRTVINLRSFHSDRDELGDAGLAYEHITMKPWHPEEKDVTRFLRIVTDAKRGPVLVHCMDGADRTGLVCAVYRVVVCGWSKADAIREMKEGGFGFHSVWKNLVPFVQKLDVEAIKRKAGMPAGGVGTRFDEGIPRPEEATPRLLRIRQEERVGRDGCRSGPRVKRDSSFRIAIRSRADKQSRSSSSGPLLPICHCASPNPKCQTRNPGAGGTFRPVMGFYTIKGLKLTARVCCDTIAFRQLN